MSDKTHTQIQERDLQGGTQAEWGQTEWEDKGNQNRLCTHMKLSNNRFNKNYF